MKRLLIAFVFLSIGGLAFADEIKVDSKIAAVTVYPGAARITREAKVNVPVGAVSVRLANIASAFDENSLTVTGNGSAVVKIFGAYLKSEFLKEDTDKRSKDLQKEKEQVEDQLALERVHVLALDEQNEFINSIKLFAGQQIPKDLVTKMPTPPELEELSKFLMTKREDLISAHETSRLKIRELDKEVKRLNQELGQLGSVGNKEERSIVVDLEASQPGELTLEVSYLVAGTASWEANYDARTNMDQGIVELVAYGAIKQATGEDWNNVRLTLSTAQPTIGGRMPYVQPWFLKIAQPQSVGVMRENLIVMGRRGQSVAYDAAFSKELASSIEAEPQENRAETAYADVGQKGISVTYNIAKLVTILSDGTQSRYPITTQTLKANFEYSAYPRFSDMAYLGSRVINANDLQLLAGGVNLFLEGEFVGKSSIDNVGPGQDFDLYLGVDENVKIKREEIQKKVDDMFIAGIQSANHKITYKYKMTVENFTKKPIAFKLFEAMPVSQEDRIKVKIVDASIEPTMKDWKDRKGVWLWEMKLNPKAKKEIMYSFIIEYPKSIEVEGL